MHPIIIGTSTKLATAKFSWKETIKMAENCELLSQELPALHVREAAGEERFYNNHDSSYMFASPNRNAGRSYTVNRALLDELRDHSNQDCYDGVVNAGNALMDFQVVAITNQGDSSSVVLEDQRSAAIEFINTGVGNPTTFLAEYSAPSGCDPTDVEALAMANPNLNIRNPLIALMGQAIESKKKGGEKLARFRTENLCQKVHLLDPAIEPDIWNMCVFKETETNKYPNLASHRRTVTLCLDMSPLGDHATLMAVADIEGMLYCEVVKVWYGFNCSKQVRADLPDLVAKINPRAFGWFPGGPAAVIAADLKAKPGWNKQWPPRNVKIIELKAEQIPAVCMGLANIIHSVQMYHPGDELLTQHVKQTQKLPRGDAWIFDRVGLGPIDATYALAGAVHLNRTLPAPLKPVSTGREPTETQDQIPY